MSAKNRLPSFCGRRSTAVAAFVAGLTGAVPAAHAQRLLDQYITNDIPGIGVEPGVTVASRQRPEYDSLGIRVGEVTIRPELRETLGYEDNVLGGSKAKGSVLVGTNARVRADYDHSDTTGYAQLTGDDNRYPQQDGQSYTNWTAGIGATHQFGRDTGLVAYEHLSLNQTLRDLDVPNLDRALPYRVDTVRLGYRAMFSRVFIQPTLGVSNYEFDNGTVNGKQYLQTYRNRITVDPAVTLGYELAPQRNLVVVVRDTVASYRNQVLGSPKRDFNDVTVLAGLDFVEGSLWRYRLLAGYESRTFTDRRIKSIQSPVVEAQVIWNPTGLTTVTASATRHIQDSADETTVGFTETAVGLRVDHELLRNVILQANGAYLIDDYNKGQGHQELFTLGTGATWLMNRNMRLVGTYDFTQRTSSGTGNLGVITNQVFGSGYTDNRFLVQLRLAL